MRTLVKRFLGKTKAPYEQRVDRNNGGQRLDRFLAEFEDFVREETLNEVVGLVRKHRSKPFNQNK
jgi:hypothetical protein